MIIELRGVLHLLWETSSALDTSPPLGVDTSPGYCLYSLSESVLTEYFHLQKTGVLLLSDAILTFPVTSGCHGPHADLEMDKWCFSGPQKQRGGRLPEHIS